MGLVGGSGRSDLRHRRLTANVEIAFKGPLFSIILQDQVGDIDSDMEKCCSPASRFGFFRDLRAPQIPAFLAVILILYVNVNFFP